jgi:CheY-like chemotaxis protein
MGGEITVTSTPGKGSVFSFTIKVEKSDEEALTDPEAPAVTDDFFGYFALLVEDVELNREIVKALLEPTQLVIDCAENGVEAVRMFSKNPGRYNIIFMDLQMPEMDGYEATRAIRALDHINAANVPIIAMTANVFKEDIENSIAAGMNDHIGKPLDINTVLHKLSQYLYPQDREKDRRTGDRRKSTDRRKGSDRRTADRRKGGATPSDV